MGQGLEASAAQTAVLKSVRFSESRPEQLNSCVMQGGAPLQPCSYNLEKELALAAEVRNALPQAPKRTPIAAWRFRTPKNRTPPVAYTPGAKLLYFFLLGSSAGFTYTNSTGDIPWT